MKVTVLPDGSVEFEVHDGDGQSALDLIRSLQGVREDESVEDKSVEDGGPVEVLLDPALLTPTQRTVYDVLAEHPTGCHASAVAQELNLEQSIVNARLVALKNRGFAERLRPGTYRLAGEDVPLTE